MNKVNFYAIYSKISNNVVKFEGFNIQIDNNSVVFKETKNDVLNYINSLFSSKVDKLRFMYNNSEQFDALCEFNSKRKQSN